MPNHVSGMVLQAVADSFVTAFAIAAVTAFIAAITPAWLAVAGVVLLGVGVAVMANIPEESVPDWLKPVKKGADGIADKAVKMLKEGPASVVEDIGQGLMDEIQTPEGIASVAGGTVGTLAGGYAGSRVNSALKVEKENFVGRLKGEDIKFDDVKMKQIKYVKRSPEELSAFRKEFNSSVRKDFLKELSKDTNKLKVAGISDTDILKLRNGRVPDGWQVHHKLPLDDSGTNAYNNLVLIKNNPYHKAITNYQNSITKGFKVGSSNSVKWPIIKGNIYPACN